jgi:preprotein translocase subunit SecY
VQPKSDGQLPAALMAAEHLSLRVNPNGMMPMILASVVVHILPVGVGPFLGPVAGAALAAFQNSPIAYCVAVFFADFASLTAQTPKRLAQYLQTVQTLHPSLAPFLTPSPVACCWI